jgi:hypothetical protein
VERRRFLASLIGGVTAGTAGLTAGQQQGGGARKAPESYMWRQFLLRNGTQPRRLSEFLQNAALPALNRLGHTPVGVFDVVAGAATPSVFVLIPSATLDALGALEDRLERDTQFLRDGAGYLDAQAADPVYVRQETSMFAAFPTVPRIEIPPQTATKSPRLFELRTYESASEKALREKIRMFAEMGEIDIFRRVGLRPVFFARAVAGLRMPNLTYMLVHDNMAAREKSWAAFRDDPEWKKLASTPGYSNADIVSNITTVYLQPAAYSQI